MAPLTSPPGCGSCARLADKISELECRISTLYDIREAEELMDTVIFPAAPTCSTSAPIPGAGRSGPAKLASEASSSPEVDFAAGCPAADCPAADALLPGSLPDDSWARGLTDSASTCSAARGSHSSLPVRRLSIPLFASPLHTTLHPSTAALICTLLSKHLFHPLSIRLPTTGG
ncbi:unnamed protein product [Merluccius merluccius]